MENTRETKSFTTPKGNEVVIYTYLTGRERRDMQNVFLKDVELASMSGDTPEFKNFKASSLTEAQDFLIGKLIVSINGATGNTLDTVLNLPADEYEFILAEVNKATGDWDKKKQG